MNMNGPTENDIMATLRESGYLMEQEVATVFEKLGFNVETNYAFEDTDEGKSRELDVRAFVRKIHNDEAKLSLDVCFLCECKNNRNPFVFLGRDKSTIDKNYTPEEYVFQLSYDVEVLHPRDSSITAIKIVPAWFHLDLAKHHYYTNQLQKAVQFCKITQKNKVTVQSPF